MDLKDLKKFNSIAEIEQYLRDAGARGGVIGNSMAVPALCEGMRIVVQPDVWYFDNPDRQYTFTTITALDTTSGAGKDVQTYLLGSGMSSPSRTRRSLSVMRGTGRSSTRSLHRPSGVRVSGVL